MERAKVFEILTLCGWVRVTHEVWNDYQGVRRWKYFDENQWHTQRSYEDEVIENCE